MIHDVISLQSLSILNTGLATHLNKPNYLDSVIDISFSLPDLIWLATWYILTDLHGNENFPINHFSKFYYSINLNTSNSSFVLLNFNFNKANCNLFSQLIKSNTSFISDTIRINQWFLQQLAALAVYCSSNLKEWSMFSVQILS